MADKHLSLDEVMPLLAIRQDPHGEVVHTFVDGGIALLGADWTLAELRRQAKGHHMQMAGPGATAMHHGVVLVRREVDGGSVFLETKEVTNGD